MRKRVPPAVAARWRLRGKMIDYIMHDERCYGSCGMPKEVCVIDAPPLKNGGKEVRLIGAKCCEEHAATAMARYRSVVKAYREAAKQIGVTLVTYGWLMKELNWRSRDIKNAFHASIAIRSPGGKGFKGMSLYDLKEFLRFVKRIESRRRRRVTGSEWASAAMLEGLGGVGYQGDRCEVCFRQSRRAGTFSKEEVVTGASNRKVGCFNGKNILGPMAIKSTLLVCKEPGSICLRLRSDEIERIEKKRAEWFRTLSPEEVEYLGVRKCLKFHQSMERALARNDLAALASLMREYAQTEMS